MEPYLLLDINRYVKCSLTRFRFGIFNIFVHGMRYKSNVTTRELMCPFCSISIENEVHFVLCCPGLDDLRGRYIRPKYFNFPSDFRLTLLLSTKNERTLQNLALYLYKAFNRRKIIMSWSILNIKVFMMDLQSLCCYLFVFCVITVFDFKHVCAVWCLRNVPSHLIMCVAHFNRGYGLTE